MFSWEYFKWGIQFWQTVQAGGHSSLARHLSSIQKSIFSTPRTRKCELINEWMSDYIPGYVYSESSWITYILVFWIFCTMWVYHIHKFIQFLSDVLPVLYHPILCPFYLLFHSLIKSSSCCPYFFNVWPSTHLSGTLLLKEI